MRTFFPAGYFNARMIIHAITLFAALLTVGLSLTERVSAQIVTVLKGEDCSDGPVTLNEGDPPLLGARCESAGVCAPTNPFAGIAAIVVSQFTCSGTPVDNFAFSHAKVGGGINANVVAQSVFFGRTVGTGNASADCTTGEHMPPFVFHPEGCFQKPPAGGGGVDPIPCPDCLLPGPGGGCGIDVQCPSPIIIDTEGEGFQLTSAAKGVVFDIRGDGHPIQVAWTDSNFRNAFLALPGPDGLIHNGKELFGNFTPQDPSSRRNGFLALAEFDEPDQGGNGDGIIDERDAVFSRLRLWIDENHDGISQPSELHTLSEFGVFSIGLDYQMSPKKDRYGNEFRYRARVNPGQHRDRRDEASEVGRWIYDVFFVTK